MSEPLTRFELDAVLELLVDHDPPRPALLAQVPHLRVHSREFTGVGVYVNFEWPDDPEIPVDSERPSGFVGSNKYIETEGIAHGLVFFLHVEAGRLHCLELVTFCDPWDGTVGPYKFIRTHQKRP